MFHHDEGAISNKIQVHVKGVKKYMNEKNRLKKVCVGLCSQWLTYFPIAMLPEAGKRQWREMRHATPNAALCLSCRGETQKRSQKSHWR